MTINKALGKRMLTNVIGGGKSWTSTLLLLLAFLAFSACTEDNPASQTPENLIKSPAADSTSVGDSIFVDPAWADTIDYNFDNDAELNITIPDGTPEEGDAGGAV